MAAGTAEDPTEGLSGLLQTPRAIFPTRLQFIGTPPARRQPHKEVLQTPGAIFPTRLQLLRRLPNPGFGPPEAAGRGSDAAERRFGSQQTARPIFLTRPQLERNPVGRRRSPICRSSSQDSEKAAAMSLWKGLPDVCAVRVVAGTGIPPKGPRPISTLPDTLLVSPSQKGCLNPPKGPRPISTTRDISLGKQATVSCLNPPKGPRPISTSKTRL